MLIKTSLCSILVLSSLALQEALIFLSDCQASKQFFPLTLYSGEWWSCIFIYSFRPSLWRNTFFLGAAWVSPRYAHCDLLLPSEQWYSHHWSMSMPWFKVFLKPHSLSQAAKMEKNNSNGFAAFARRERGETRVTLRKWGQDRQNEAAASKNQQSLVRVTFAKCSQLYIGNPTCRSDHLRCVPAGATLQSSQSPRWSLEKSSATAKPAAVFPAYAQFGH